MGTGGEPDASALRTLLGSEVEVLGEDGKKRRGRLFAVDPVSRSLVLLQARGDGVRATLRCRQRPPLNSHRRRQQCLVGSRQQPSPGDCRARWPSCLQMHTPQTQCRLCWGAPSPPWRVRSVQRLSLPLTTVASSIVATPSRCATATAMLTTQTSGTAHLSAVIAPLVELCAQSQEEAAAWSPSRRLRLLGFAPNAPQSGPSLSAEDAARRRAALVAHLEKARPAPPLSSSFTPPLHPRTDSFGAKPEHAHSRFALPNSANPFRSTSCPLHPLPAQQATFWSSAASQWVRHTHLRRAVRGMCSCWTGCGGWWGSWQIAGGARGRKQATMAQVQQHQRLKTERSRVVPSSGGSVATKPPRAVLQQL